MKEKLAYPFISLVIAVIIGLQSVAVFGRVTSFFWPFVDYPMYHESHYEGEAINVRHHLIGILEGSGEVEILPKDLGIEFWQFQMDLSDAIKYEKLNIIEPYVQYYENRTGKHLIGLRLEEHPITLTREGFEPAPIEVVKTLNLPASGKE